MIRAVFFDLDGTLFDRAAALRQHGLALFDRQSSDFPPERRAADLLALVRAIGDPPRDRRGFARALASAFPGLGWDPAAIAADCVTPAASFAESAAGAIDLVAKLAGQFKVAIVSNGSGRVQRAKLASIGLGGNSPRAFLSGEHGVAKPAPALFRMALDWARCRPDEALFVGDDPICDIAGAAAVGMATCWVAAGRTYPPGLPVPGRTVDRVADLAGMMG